MTLRLGLLVASLLAVTPVGLRAQGAVDLNTGRLYATRESLQDLLHQLQLAANSPAYSQDMRSEAATEAARIRRRLEAGDFQTGDQIFLTVEGEEALTDTFSVVAGPALELPVVGHFPLSGVLRAELRDHLRTELARFIRNPVVHTRTLIRMSVVGEVTSPGFYVVPTEGLITDVITRAGGPTREADLDGITIERQSMVIWEAGPLTQALIEGRTLDQMNLLAGDRVIVPTQSRGLAAAEGAVRTLALLLSIPLTIFAISQIF